MRLRKTTSLLITAAFLAFSSSVASAQTKRVTIAGGPIGGTFYVLATGFAKILTEDLDMSASVEVGAGGSQNIILVNEKLADYGITTGSLLGSGLQGLSWSKGKKYEDARVLFGMQLSYFHFWALKSAGVTKLDDLNGKIVNLSQKGSGADVAGLAAFDMFGIKPDKIVNVGHSQANQLMQDGLADAALTTGGIPHPAVAALSATHDVVEFGLTGEQADKFVAANPGLAKATIPAGTYRGQSEPVPTTGDWNVMLAHKDIPDDVIYNVVKKTFENIPKWVSVHKAAATTKPENIRDISGLPIHPGALRYYKEIGILK
tara:strand:+ start:1054 stop:2004 length:951 start_codon:yes stop_codon:yes gene_type:complete